MDLIEEFWYCVAPQEDLPVYKGASVSCDSCTRLIEIINKYKELKNRYTSQESINKIILDNPASISDLRILAGISDKRLYLDLTYLVNIYKNKENVRFVPESREHLIKHNTVYFINLLIKSKYKEIFADEVTNYFISQGLIETLDTFSLFKSEQIEKIFQNLIAPKELQQKLAKYRGHGAEQAFAKVVRQCGLEIIPQNKDENPMAGYDPNIDLSNMEIVKKNAEDVNCHSIDMAILDKNSDIRVIVQSLIHSSDPGQYGVNKSDETIEIGNKLKIYNKNHESSKIYLLGCVDGVGFCENPNGTIVKMIDVFDDFIQMHTLFKIPLFLQRIGIINNIKGVAFDTDYFDKNAINHFVNKYMQSINVTDMTNHDLSGLKYIQAGKAKVVFK